MPVDWLNIDDLEIEMAMNSAVLKGVVVLAALWMAGAAHALQDFTSQQRSLDQYTGNGRWLVVMIWASDCPVCNREVAEYANFHDRWGGRASVLGISMDGAARFDEARDFVKRHRLTFPNLIGEPGEVAALFSRLAGRAWVGTPSFLVFDPEGGISAQQVGAVPVSLIERHIESGAGR